MVADSYRFPYPHKQHYMNETKQLVDIVNSAIVVALSDVHTICIAVVTVVNEKTISCRPVINRVIKGEDIVLPEFVDVPPVFMKGGSSYTAHPIVAGDYCLLLVTERCFDKWWIGQDFMRPLEMRMHDYSDGFALVGINNLAGLITIPSVITQIGDTYQEGNYEHLGDVEQTGNYTQTGDVTITGNLVVDGNINCTGVITCQNAIIGGINFLTHIHGGVTAGGAKTAVPE